MESFRIEDLEMGTPVDRSKALRPSFAKMVLEDVRGCRPQSHAVRGGFKMMPKIESRLEDDAQDKVKLEDDVQVGYVLRGKEGGDDEVEDEAAR